MGKIVSGNRNKAQQKLVFKCVSMFGNYSVCVCHREARSLFFLSFDKFDNKGIEVTSIKNVS